MLIQCLEKLLIAPMKQLSNFYLWQILVEVVELIFENRKWNLEALGKLRM